MKRMRMRMRMRMAAVAATCALAIALTACGGGGESSTSQPAASQPAASGGDVPAGPNYGLGLTEGGRYEGVTATEVVTLPEGYLAIPMDENYFVLPQEMVDGAVDDFMAQFAQEKKVTDRAVAEGDRVNIDYVGYLDGKPFQGGDTQGQGADHTAGSDELIDDFLTQIVGAMPGDTLDVVVTFPDPYQEPTLSGKEATFVTTVNYIVEEVVPELTEQFVTDTLKPYFGYTSIQDLRQKLEAKMLDQYQYELVLDWLYDNSIFGEIPQTLIDHQRQVLTTELTSAADSYGMTLEELATQVYGAASVDDLLEQYSGQMENFVRQHLMCQAVAEEQGLVVDDAALTDYFAGQMGIDDHQSYLDQYGRPYLCQLVQTELVAQLLMAGVVAK